MESKRHSFKAIMNYLKLQMLMVRLKIAGFDIEDVDVEYSQVLVSLRSRQPLILYINGADIDIDMSFLVSSDIMTLKTLSALNFMAMYGEVSIGGLRPETKQRVRFSLSKAVPLLRMLLKPKEVIHKFNLAVSIVDSELDLRLAEHDNEFYDISMFENLDITNFSPRLHAEKKEFSFGSWDNYLNHLGKDTSLLGKRRFNEAQACMLFENRNNATLADMGDRVENMIIWSKGVTQASEDDEFSLN